MSKSRPDDRRVDLRAVRLAVEELFEAHGDRVYARAMSILGDHQGAEDAVQETFVSAGRAISRGSVPEFPVPWLLTIVRRKAGRLARRSGRPSIPLTREPQAPPDRHHLEAAEERSRVHDALSRLSDEDRELLTLRYLDGLPPRVLCKKYGVSRSTLWERIAGARDRMRRVLRTEPE